MATSINLFYGRIHPQGVGRRVPRCCAATLSLAASRVGYGHRFAVSHRLCRYEPSPQLRCRSFLAYQFDMWLRHNLKVSLRRNSLCSFSRRSLCGSLRFIP